MNNQTLDLKNKYNPEGSNLRALQNRMLEILICVDKICKENNIKYWLSSGTLLGAVRHGGFIPWDDDIDIEMKKEDYIKFLSIVERVLPYNYVLHNHETDNNYPYIYSKIRDLNSNIKEICIFNQDLKYNGAFIDIFPLEDTIPTFRKISNILYNRLCLGIINKNKLIFKINYYLLRKLVFPVFRLFTSFSNNKELHYSYGIGFLSESRSCDDIFPLKSIVFEGHKFYSPNYPDRYLKRLYGEDYMKIPKEIKYHIKDSNISIW